MDPVAMVHVEGSRLCLRCAAILDSIPALQRTTDQTVSIVLVGGERRATLATLARVRRESPRARLLGVFCVPAGSAPPALEYFARGLDDHLSCPWTEADLNLRLQRLRPATAPDVESSEWQQQTSLIGRNAGFVRMLGQLARAARSRATMLLTGETGTGKELVARAIHYLSERSHCPFVPLNCGAIPDHLFENELFGHAKGAFTDASAHERGLIAEAEGGTFFFDEVDAFSPAVQVKLLRLLQDREYRPLGATRSLVADVRIAAATNADLGELVRARTFREDLYHRLCVITLHVPPLRERADDIPLLARHFLWKYRDEAVHVDCHFDDSALARLVEYHWPGNIRELESVIHRALILSTSCVLRAEDLDIRGIGAAEPARPDYRASDEQFRQAKERAIYHFETSYLRDLLTRHRGNVSRAARAAGTDRRALQRLLDKHKLNRVAYRESA
jgi:DNA-binding NtrC family response regulator